MTKNWLWLQFYMANINGYIESHTVAWSPSMIIISEPLQACLMGLNSSVTLASMSASSPSTHLSAERFPRTLNLHERKWRMNNFPNLFEHVTIFSPKTAINLSQMTTVLWNTVWGTSLWLDSITLSCTPLALTSVARSVSTLLIWQQE